MKQMRVRAIPVITLPSWRKRGHAVVERIVWGDRAALHGLARAGRLIQADQEFDCPTDRGAADERTPAVLRVRAQSRPCRRWPCACYVVLKTFSVPVYPLECHPEPAKDPGLR